VHNNGNKKDNNFKMISVVTGNLRSYRNKEGDLEVRCATAICESIRGVLRYSYTDGWAICPAIPVERMSLEDIQFIPILRRPHDDEESFDQTRRMAREAVDEARSTPRSTVGEPPGLTQNLDLSRVKI